MADQSTLRSIIESLPNNPEKIFESLDLPITYIDDVKLEKNGKNRVFKYENKDLFSPEIVAVVFYENQGHIASWNEGLALSMVQDALERLLTSNLFDQLEYIGIKKEAFLISPKYDITLDRAITRNEQLASSPATDSSIIEMNSDSIERSHLREKSIIEKRTHFPISVHRLLHKQSEWVKFLIDRMVSVTCKCDANELIEIFHQNIADLKRNKTKLIEAIKLPEKTNDHTDHQQKFINKWTLKFTHQMADICDLDYLLEEAFRYSPFSNRWDVMLIDKNTNKIRYIEIKMDDNFTPVQRTNLPVFLSEGGNLELCKIRPSAK